MAESERIRFSAEYVQHVSSAAVRDYLVESGIPLVEGYFENGPSDNHDRELAEGDSTLLLLGDGGHEAGAYYLDCASGAVWYRVRDASFFVNSSPRQFAESLRAYLEVTYGELAGDDELVAERLRMELSGIDPAAVEDSDSLWSDIIGDVAIGIYGDDPE